MRLIRIITCLACAATGCGTRAAAGESTGDFSVVTGVPADWLGRVDESRYLDAPDCASLCPRAYRARVTSCHLARVVGAPSSPDTAAVVCNGGETRDP